MKDEIGKIALEVAQLPAKELRRIHYEEGITPEEEVFCREYLGTMDLKKAITAAGYTGRHPTVTARRWLNKPKVKERMQQMQKRDEIRADVTRDKYHQMLIETYDRAMADGDYSGANRAAELLGKSMGYFVEQKAILNVTSRVEGDKSAKVAEIQRLARIAGVKLE
jgi:phage terminase small subunit